VVLSDAGPVCLAGFGRNSERQALSLESYPDGGEEMKQFLIVLLCVVVGVLAGFVLSHAVIDLLLPSTEALTFANDHILLG
jgi:hypothetical protein